MVIRRTYLLLLGLVLGFTSLLASCAHQGQPATPGPWSMIENPDAREKYLMVQQASASLPYKKLYYNIKLLSEMYPEEDVITITKAGIYGDYGQTLSEEKEKQYKQIAIESLQPFINKTYPSPVSHDRVLAFNQYFYHSGQFKKQYDYGHQVKKLGGKGGEVLIAVGGSMYALNLDLNGQHDEAERVAQDARRVWEEMYDLSHPEMKKAAQQNSFYISSLAITGSCGRAHDLFENHLKESFRYQELERWYQRFDPQNIKACQNLRNLTSH